MGRSDLPIGIARNLIGKEKIIGATAKTSEQAQEAYEQGADYLGVVELSDDNKGKDDF